MGGGGVRLKRREEAFNQALEVCRDHGLNWRTNIQPIIKKKQIAGYYVLDETFSTAIKKIII